LDVAARTIAPNARRPNIAKRFAFVMKFAPL
jgi:hypothetical protein